MLGDVSRLLRGFSYLIGKAGNKCTISAALTYRGLMLPLKDIYKATSIPDPPACPLHGNVWKVREVEQKAPERRHATKYIKEVILSVTL